MAQLALAAIETARMLARLSPVWLVSWIGSILGRTILARRKRNGRARANLRRAFPDIAEAELQATTRAMWDSYGRTLAETLVLEDIAAAADRVILENPEVLEQDAELGTVFVGMHFANWEVNAIPALSRFPDFAGIYKPFKSRALDIWIRKRRAGFYPGGLFEATAAGVLRAARHVRKGGTVSLLADHRDHSGPLVDFFGHPAPSTALPALLGRRFGARIIAARTLRLPGARFRVRLERIAVQRTDDEQADIHETTAVIQAHFEAVIRENPSAFTWFHKRWTDDPYIPSDTAAVEPADQR